jgi:hypothetical protein
MQNDKTVEVKKLDFVQETVSDFEDRLSDLLPIKPGDLLYTADEEGIHEWAVASFSVLGTLVWPESEDPDVKHIYVESESGKDNWFSLYDIGNEVFLDRDSALEYKAVQFGLSDEEQDELCMPFD